MKKIKLKFFLLTIFLLFSFPLGNSQPTLFNPIPYSGSYIPVGSKNFSINVISPNLNTSAVFLIMRAEYIEEWETFQMNCENYTLSDWVCNVLMPLGIVGSDTVEYYYFKATDLDGNTGYYGSNESPLKVTVDGKPPEIEFIYPQNNSWIGNIIRVEVAIEDSSSGVNEESVFFSIDNETWTKMNREEYFVTNFDTTQFENNESVTLYVKASDEVNNTAIESINVRIDNELPLLTILQPEEGKSYTGIIQVEVNASDTYSGIDFSSAIYSVDGISGNLSFLNNSFVGELDTSLLEDGEHNITFTAYDNAGNSNSSTIKIITQNIYPSVRLVYPSNNSFTSKNTYINVTIINPGGIAKWVEIRFSKAGYISDWINMSKINEQNYSYYLDISSFQDGEYDVMVRVANPLDLLINSSFLLTIDREAPSIDVVYPEYWVKNSFDSQIIVLDSYKLNNTVKFEVGNYSEVMNCEEELEGKKLICAITFDSSLLEDGINKIKFYAKDLAGNEVVKEKEISVDNNPPYLYYLKVEPIQAANATTFKILAYPRDDGSEVKNVELILNYPDGTKEPIEMENISSSISRWLLEKDITREGGYFIDLNITDSNNNFGYVEKAGYFYLGPMKCGDGNCQKDENYCICPADCGIIKCEANEFLDCGSGIPKCLPSYMKENNYCGDEICFGTESCSNCEIDCRRCLAFGERSKEGMEISLPKLERERFMLILFALIPAIAFLLIVVFVFLKKEKKERKIELVGKEVERASEYVANALVSTTVEEFKEHVEEAIKWLKKFEEKSEEKEKIDRIIETLYSSLKLDMPEARKKIIEVSLMIKELE